jgi:hypothetical protein
MEYWMFLGVAYIQFDINETIEWIPNEIYSCVIWLSMVSQATHIHFVVKSITEW